LLSATKSTIWELMTAKRSYSKTTGHYPMELPISSYLINDEKTALVDTLEFGSKDDYLDEIAGHLNGKELDYIVVNHMEPDHSSMIGVLLKFYRYT